MRVIGLTGSIACGKSTVSAYLVSHGFPVIDGDRISRGLTAPGSPVLEEIRRAFGPDVFYGDGTLNRRRLGRLVFGDPASRKVLDDMMAPYLLRETRRQVDAAAASGAPLCFLDMPLLFEKGYDRLCDTVWTVWLPEKVQLERLMQRDGFTVEEAMDRIRSVLSSDEKAARANRVIDNSGPVEQTYAIVSGLLSEESAFMARSQSPRRSARAQQDNRPDAVPPVPPVSAVPQVMERPASSSRKRTPRKAEWRLPLWLKSSLVTAAALLMVGITAFLLMNAYLKNCRDRHAEEQANIDRQYPLLYRSMIEESAAEFNLSPAFVAAVIRNESSFNPRAESGVGARGLMQLMPDTAEWIAGKLRVTGYAFERMYDAASNIRFGCWYLNYLSGLYMGDPVAVTAAYHAGQGQVKVWLSDPLLSENGYSLPVGSLPEGPTKKYAGRVLRDYGIYQEKYFMPDLLPPDRDGGLSAGGSQ